ncbi:hypothetical protein [Marinifilum caeruleilacunae]|uniref:PH domain-containing protein n=1 Tax=Marinifilum caeruleilacunae TaxID=2499076 RepID=A0ABX1X0Q5_9BACT|nr:hypothetical protein [Marinifilum caeruleilacunae]NOU61983.1 hypothetical protein [Marinifilum caeruleilacunae]
MKSKHTLRILSLYFVIAIFIVGLIRLGVLCLNFGAYKSEGVVGIIGGLLLIWMGLGYFALMVGKIKRILIKDNNLIVRKILLNKESESRLSKVQFTEFEWQMTWNTVRGILVRLENGEIEQISIKEFYNSHELIKLIKENGIKDDSIKPKIHTGSFKVFMLLGILISIAMLLLKL